jgi:hypothetical protein
MQAKLATAPVLMVSELFLHQRERSTIWQRRK